MKSFKEATDNELLEYYTRKEETIRNAMGKINEAMLHMKAVVSEYSRRDRNEEI